MNNPTDPRVREIVERVRAVQAKNNPTGLPGQDLNQDNTMNEDPMRKDLPQDPGWSSKDLIAGTGNGPELSSVV